MGEMGSCFRRLFISSELFHLSFLYFFVHRRVYRNCKNFALRVDLNAKTNMQMNNKSLNAT
ncbi:hypothetical protein BpHYR1_030513 [Brachionus plicatilis]|uniref:Uncharacterized protein n=1 Tax=Brachionus plicatilis TaxID=10195 RepID=A0A3M7P3E4_BRAPC|nr:hypothetical protein BpHYR1_030513 [Brachionus plicatilis]